MTTMILITMVAVAVAAALLLKVKPYIGISVEFAKNNSADTDTTRTRCSTTDCEKLNTRLGGFTFATTDERLKEICLKDRTTKDENGKTVILADYYGNRWKEGEASLHTLEHIKVLAEHTVARQVFKFYRNYGDFNASLGKLSNTTVSYLPKKVEIVLGTDFTETIQKKGLPISRYDWASITLLTKAEELEPETKEFALYSVTTSKLERDYIDVKKLKVTEEEQVLAMLTTTSKERLCGLAHTKEKAIAALREAEEELIAKKLGL